MTTQTDYDTMSGPQLVAAFNLLSPDKPVKRFATRGDALRRIKALASNGAAATAITEPEAKKEKAPPKVKPAKKTGQGVLLDFEAREGTVREKLLMALDDNFGKLVTTAVLLKAAYGSGNLENRGALMMSLKGAAATIKKNKLPYQIKKAKNEAKELTIGLFPA